MACWNHADNNALARRETFLTTQTCLKISSQDRQSQEGVRAWRNHRISRRTMALDLRCDEYAFNYASAERRREEKNLSSLEFSKGM